jgi:hypothetical protein
MLAKLNAHTLVGIASMPVEAEVAVAAGRPTTTVPGGPGEMSPSAASRNCSQEGGQATT